MNTLPAIAGGWIVCGRQPCPEDIVELAPHGDSWIKTALLTFNSDPLRMAAMRNLLHSNGEDWAAFRLPDEEVIDQVFHLFLTRRLHLHAMEVQPVITVVSDSGAGNFSGDRAAPSPPRPSSAGSGDYIADPPTFSVPLDGAAQAAALIAAATAGQPFCPQ